MKYRGLVLFFCIVFLFFSCATTQSVKDASEDQTSEQQDATGEAAWTEKDGASVVSEGTSGEISVIAEIQETIDKTDTEAGTEAEVDEVIDQEQDGKPAEWISLYTRRGKSLTTGEKIGLDELLSRIGVLLYFGEEEPSGEVSLLYRDVTEYLSQKTGVDYITPSEMDKLYNNLFSVYQKEAGDTISFLKWISINMDLDIMLIFSEEDEVPAINCFDLKSSSLLAGYSTDDSSPARENEESEYSKWEILWDSVLGLHREILVKGIPYRLIVNNVPEKKNMDAFLLQLSLESQGVEEKVIISKEDSKGSENSGENKEFRLFYIGDIERFEDMVFSAAESVPGFEKVEFVFQEREKLVIDAGM